MKKALERRVIGLPLGFWLAIVGVITVGTASALGLSDTVVFLFAIGLTLSTLPWVLEESRR